MPLPLSRTSKHTHGPANTRFCDLDLARLIWVTRPGCHVLSNSRTQIPAVVSHDADKQVVEIVRDAFARTIRYSSENESCPSSSSSRSKHPVLLFHSQATILADWGATAAVL